MFWKILGALTGVATAVAAVIFAWPAWFGLERQPIIAHVVSLRSLGAVIAVGLALAFALLAIAKALRPWALTMMSILLAFALATGLVSIARGFDNAALGPEHEGEITVMAWNTLGDEPDAQVIADAITSTGADVVALPETRSEIGVDVSLILRDRGTPFWVHTTWTNEGEDYGALSTSLLISAELGSYTTDLSVGQTRTLPTIVARPDDGEGPVLIAVHAVAPVPHQLANWRADLEFLAGLCDGSNVLMAGDFNSTVDHWFGLASPEHDLGQCRDSALATGSGSVGTWPVDLPPALGTPIDHVLVSDHWVTVGTEVLTSLDGTGSDHRVMIARIAPAG